MTKIIGEQKIIDKPLEERLQIFQEKLQNIVKETGISLNAQINLVDVNKPKNENQTPKSEPTSGSEEEGKDGDGNNTAGDSK